MKQVVRNKMTKPKVSPKKPTTRNKQLKKSHPKYGTSKLEEDFAKEFLDKLGLEYEYQFEAKDIGRFFDFLVSKNVIIEINGSYWHGDPRLYEEKDLNKTQKHARAVDEYKEKWALSHGFPIYYIWENDIRKNPEKVMTELKKIFYIDNKKADVIHKKTDKVTPRKKIDKKI